MVMTFSDIIKRHPLEHLYYMYNYKKEAYNKPTCQNSLSIYAYISLFLIMIMLLIPTVISIILLIQNDKLLPKWMIIIGWMMTLLPIIPFGNIITIMLIIFYIHRNK